MGDASNQNVFVSQTMEVDVPCHQFPQIIYTDVAAVTRAAPHISLQHAVKCRMGNLIDERLFLNELSNALSTMSPDSAVLIGKGDIP